MTSNAERVRQFHSAVGDSSPPTPTHTDKAVLSLRRTLIEEESREVLEAFAHLQEAVSEGDKAVRFGELVHELIDMLYVTYGALAAFGVEADEAFREVHRANMQKVSGPKREDGKQLKPEDWQPADIPGVLAAQKRRG
jgi:predicted HAD superfamily Cof-like phosphohydrolase